MASVAGPGRTAKTPLLWTSPFTADNAADGLDWLSAVTTTIFRPLIPPEALAASIAAVTPGENGMFCTASPPVRSDMTPIFTSVGVTP